MTIEKLIHIIYYAFHKDSIEEDGILSIELVHIRDTDVEIVVDQKTFRVSKDLNVLEIDGKGTESNSDTKLVKANILKGYANLLECAVVGSR